MPVITRSQSKNANNSNANILNEIKKNSEDEEVNVLTSLQNNFVYIKSQLAKITESFFKSQKVPLVNEMLHYMNNHLLNDDKKRRELSKNKYLILISTIFNKMIEFKNTVKCGKLDELKNTTLVDTFMNELELTRHYCKLILDQYVGPMNEILLQTKKTIHEYEQNESAEQYIQSLLKDRTQIYNEYYVKNDNKKRFDNKYEFDDKVVESEANCCILIQERLTNGEIHYRNYYFK